MKNAIEKRNKSFKLWICDNDTYSKKKHEVQRNVVTKLMKQAKREANFQKSGENPSSKVVFRTLKNHSRVGEQTSMILDPSSLNQYFTSIGKLLSSKEPPHEQTFKSEKSEMSIVLCETDPLEVAKTIRSMKNKKLTSRWISNEILKCCTPITDKYQL